MKLKDKFFDDLASIFFFVFLWVGLVGVVWFMADIRWKSKKAELAQDCLMILNIVCANKQPGCEKEPILTDCLESLEKMNDL